MAGRRGSVVLGGRRSLTSSVFGGKRAGSPAGDRPADAPRDPGAAATEAAATDAAAGGGRTAAAAGGGGARCPSCDDAWDVNHADSLTVCCGVRICGRKGCAERPGDNTLCLLCGTPTPPTDAAAVAMLRRLVDDGDAAATRHLGQCYDLGDLGLHRSETRALRWYKRAAALGDAVAAYNVGVAVAGADPEEAARLWAFASEGGVHRAANNLAVAATADGDAATAERLLQSAAAAGLADAEYNLGAARARDGAWDDAAAWYERAAAKDHAAAQANLARIRWWRAA